MNYFMIAFLLLIFFQLVQSALMEMAIMEMTTYMAVWTMVKLMVMARLMVTQWYEFGLDRPTQPM